jgi:hypothetical protein
MQVRLLYVAGMELAEALVWHRERSPRAAVAHHSRPPEYGSHRLRQIPKT